MYKWPQGRVIRTISLLFVLLVVFDLSYSGAFGQLGAETKDDHTKQLIIGSVFAALAFAALVSGVMAVGFHHRAVDFLIEVEDEMTKVEWPKLNNLVRSTIIIAVAVVIMAALIFCVDIFNFHFINIWWPSSYNWVANILSSK
jgi:preprotein translocase SecE subunit